MLLSPNPLHSFENLFSKLSNHLTLDPKSPNRTLFLFNQKSVESNKALIDSFIIFNLLSWRIWTMWVRVLRESKGKILKRSHNNENWVKSYKQMRHSIQSLKALGLWVFFLYVAQLFYFYPMWDLDSHLNT